MKNKSIENLAREERDVVDSIATLGLIGIIGLSIFVLGPCAEYETRSYQRYKSKIDSNYGCMDKNSGLNRFSLLYKVQNSGGK